MALPGLEEIDGAIRGSGSSAAKSGALWRRSGGGPCGALWRPVPLRLRPEIPERP